MSDRWFSHWY